jgi:DNA-directed RNA polymerase subunit F
LPRKAFKKEMVTVPEVKQLLETLGEENLDQFQRRAFDYAAKFAKARPKPARKLVKDLVSRFQLEEGEAVQLVNCMPASVAEIRVFLSGGRKIVETQKLENILKLLNQHRKSE